MLLYPTHFTIWHDDIGSYVSIRMKLNGPRKTSITQGYILALFPSVYLISSVTRVWTTYPVWWRSSIRFLSDNFNTEARSCMVALWSEHILLGINFFIIFITFLLDLFLDVWKKPKHTVHQIFLKTSH